MVKTNKTGLCCSKLSKRIQEINYSNEMLSHGVIELEALYLRMQSGSGDIDEANEATETASLMNERNHSLATAINEALKEVESTLRKQKEAGEEMDMERIQEFTVVLQESIRIFHEFRLVQDGYQIRRDEAYKQSFYHFTGEEKKQPKPSQGSRRRSPIIQRLLRKMLCVCG